MGHSGINTGRIDNRAALSEAGDADHLEETLIPRMDHLQRTTRIALASVLGSAAARITGADHVRRDTTWNFSETVIVSYRAH